MTTNGHTPRFSGTYSAGGASRRKPPAFVGYLLVYTVIALSGGLLALHYPKHALLSGFALCLVSAGLYLRQINAFFVVYASAFAGILLLVHGYTGGSLPLASVLGTFISLFIAYIVLELVRDDFPRIFVNLVSVLALISLIGYAVDQVPALNGIVYLLPQFIDGAYEGFLYTFGYDTHIDRNISIFFEPAVYQGFLNAAMFMIFYVPALATIRFRRSRIAILVVALATTFSTTGYLVFFVLMAMVLTNKALVSRSTLLGIIAFGIVFTVLFAGTLRETMVDKLSLFFSGSSLEEGIELRRKFDVLADIEIFSENVWGTGFERYQEEFAERSLGFARPGDLAGSSNGITKIFAVYGVLFGLVLYGTFAAFFVKFFRFDPWVGLGGFLMYMMFLWSESLALRPMTLCLVAALFVFSTPSRRSAQPQSTRLAVPGHSRSHVNGGS